MTQLLEKAISALKERPEADQDAYACRILEELEADQHWDELFGKSQDLLARMGREALEEHRAGKTLPLDPNAL